MKERRTRRNRETAGKDLKKKRQTGRKNNRRKDKQRE